MQNNSRMKYDVMKLKEGNTIESFKLLLQNKYLFCRTIIQKIIQLKVAEQILKK